MPMITETLVFRVLLGLHSQPGRSRHRPGKKRGQSVSHSGNILFAIKQWPCTREDRKANDASAKKATGIGRFSRFLVDYGHVGTIDVMNVYNLLGHIVYCDTLLALCPYSHIDLDNLISFVET